MQPFRRILVDVDSLADAHPAVARAGELAALCGAQVTLVDVLPEVPNAARRFVTERVEQELADHRRDRLAAVARTMAQAGTLAVAPVGLLLRGRPAEAVIHEAVTGNYDLVVRSHGRDLADPVPAFGPIDKHLLRMCPCPVWIVSADHEGKPRRILAALDAGAKDPADRALNLRILGLARLMQRLEGAELSVIYAWEPYGERLLRAHMAESELGDLVQDVQEQARADLDALLKAADTESAGASPGAPPTAVLVRGEPERVLPEYIREHGIDLVVMGTVGRKGLAGLVTGNTAERVLHELRGSVLAIKPDGFVAPKAAEA